MRQFIKFFCLAALLMGMACRKAADSAPVTAPAANKRLTIAVIPKATIHEFWKSIHAGAIKAGREMNIEVIWKGALREDDRDAQITVIEDMITRGVNGIVLAPLDDVALVKPVSVATINKIPVALFDTPLKSTDYVSLVATNNRKGGEIAGEYLAKQLRGQGNVAVIRWAEGSTASNEREDGCLAVLAKYPGIKVVSSNQYGGVTIEKSMQTAENMLIRYRNPDGSMGINGVFTSTGVTALAMAQALEAASLTDKVHHVGFDSSDKLAEMLSKRKLDGLVLQDPINIGYMGVKTLVMHLQGQKVPKYIDTGCVLVTPQNMNQSRHQALLHPDYDHWLKMEK